MGEFTASTRVLSFDKTAANVSPVELMFKLYRRHFGTIPVVITGNRPLTRVLLWSIRAVLAGTHLNF